MRSAVRASGHAGVTRRTVLAEAWRCARLAALWGAAGGCALGGLLGAVVALSLGPAFAVGVAESALLVGGGALAGGAVGSVASAFVVGCVAPAVVLADWLLDRLFPEPHTAGAAGRRS